jgi:hypothetical protein
MNAEQKALEREASKHWHAHEWTEAVQCYEKLLTTSLGDLDRAKLSSNLMQCLASQGSIDAAITTGENALAAAERDSSTDGTYIHGYVTGQLRKLRGCPNPWWHFLLTPFPQYYIFALFGAILCRHLAEKYSVSICHFMADHDSQLQPRIQLLIFIHSGALLSGICGALGGWVFSMRFDLMSPRLLVACGVVSFATLALVVQFADLRTFLSWLAVLAFPWALRFVQTCFLERSVGARRVR